MNARGTLMLVAALAVLALAGCPSWFGGGHGGAEPGARSLLEIGQTALDRGEHLEEEGDYARALSAYRRAVWAFSYYEELSGRAPVLLDDAEYNVSRVERRLQGR